MLDPFRGISYLPRPWPILELVTAPDPRLKAVSKPVLRVSTRKSARFLDDMVETMYAAEGIGLAAVQIGVPKRVTVIDLDPQQGKKNQRAFCQSGDSLGLGRNRDVRGRLPVGAGNLGRCRTARPA